MPVNIRIVQPPRNEWKIEPYFIDIDEMCFSVVGLKLKAEEHPNCYIVPREIFLDALKQQRPHNVVEYWDNCCGYGSHTLYFGKWECTANSQATILRITKPLPEGSAPPEICSAWQNLTIPVDEAGYDRENNGYHFSLIQAVYILDKRGLAVFDYYNSLPSTEFIRTVFLPTEMCQIIE